MAPVLPLAPVLVLGLLLEPSVALLDLPGRVPSLVPIVPIVPVVSLAPRFLPTPPRTAVLR